MKKIMMALAMISISYFGADAKQKCTCPATVAKHTAHKHTRAYGGVTKDKYAQNFKVCQDAYGYHICGETPTCYNSTYCIPGVNTGGMAARNTSVYDDDNAFTQVQQSDKPAMQHSMVAPQSQSYPATTAYTIGTANTYEGYYPRTGKIKVYYDNGTAPYEGEPSPQDDGPAKNKSRNLNENTPAQLTSNPILALPPASGTGSGQMK